MPGPEKDGFQNLNINEEISNYAPDESEVEKDDISLNFMTNLKKGDTIANFLGLNQPYDDWYNHLDEIGSSILDRNGNPMEPKQVELALRLHETIYVYDADGDAPYAFSTNENNEILVSDGKVTKEYPLAQEVVAPKKSEAAKKAQGYNEYANNQNSTKDMVDYFKGHTGKVLKMPRDMEQKAKDDYTAALSSSAAPQVSPEPRALTGFSKFWDSVVKVFNRKGSAAGEKYRQDKALYDEQKAEYDAFKEEQENIRDAKIAEAKELEQAIKESYYNRQKTEQVIAEYKAKAKEGRDDLTAYNNAAVEYAKQPSVRIDVYSALKNHNLTQETANDLHMMILGKHTGKSPSSLTKEELAEVVLSERLALHGGAIDQVNKVGFKEAVNKLCEDPIFTKYHEKMKNPSATKNLRVGANFLAPRPEKILGAALGKNDRGAARGITIDTMVLNPMETEYREQVAQEEINNPKVEERDIAKEILDHEGKNLDDKLQDAIDHINESIDKMDISNPISMGVAKDLKQKYAALKMLQSTQDNLDKLPEDLQHKATSIAITDAFAKEPNMKNSLYAQQFNNKALDKAIENVQKSMLLGKVKNSVAMNAEFTMANAQQKFQEKQAKQQDAPKQEGPSI